EVRALMAQLGIARFDDLVGRVDLLDVDEAVSAWRERGVDLSNVLAAPEGTTLRRTHAQAPALDGALDWSLLDLEEGELPIRNVDRTVGGLLSYHAVTRADRRPQRFLFRGSAGQSFGAWLAEGIALTLVGDANDYVGKGLSGGGLALRPPEDAGFRAEEN